MGSGVETEKGLAIALDAALVQAVLATRPLKAAPGDLYLRTGSGRAKKNTSLHHIVYAAIAMVTGTPKDAVANAKGFGELIAGRIDGEVRNVEARKEDGTPVSVSVVTLDMRKRAKARKPNALLPSHDLETPAKPGLDFSAEFPEGQSFVDAMGDLLRYLKVMSKTRDLSLGMDPSDPSANDIEVWLTTRPFRHAQIVYRASSEVMIKRSFESAQLELAAQSAAQSAGLSSYKRVSYEVIGWPALVAMASLVHLEDDQENLPNSNPPPAEGSVGDVETSAVQKTEAVEAPPSTASGIHEPLTDQPQAPQRREHPTDTLSLSPREEVGMLSVSAGLWEAKPSDKQGFYSHEHANRYPAFPLVA